MKSAARAVAIMTSIALLLAVLAACTPSSQSSSSSTTTLTVATVNNSQMVQMEQLTKQVFEKVPQSGDQQKVGRRLKDNPR